VVALDGTTSAARLPALDDEAACTGDINFEEMDGGAIHVSLLAAAVHLCTSSATVELRPREVRPPPLESCPPCRVCHHRRPARGKGLRRRHHRRREAEAQGKGKRGR
jgi:hypothetical protein